MVRTALYYSLKVWLTSIIISPILFLLIDLFTKHNQTNLEGGVLFIILSTLYGLVLSSISWLLFWLWSYFLLKLSISLIAFKTVLSFFGSALTILPFVLFSRDHGFPDASTIMWALNYNVVIVAGVWFYKINSSLHL
ncbi:hypothetical protein A0256_04535 [Mucilaginibacter sp. PAMC 26640]|nr:hypothetical protein A0256_04535 [Mucilaginibacter sp. PAMC 26640]